MSQKTYTGDSIRLMIKGLVTAATPVPYGTKVEGVYFDGRSVRISPLALSIINPIAFHGVLRYN
ncbi:MAG TPA: hypothetical protein VNM68_08490 [Candidatus Polarisedimenticolia bacterium]|nr:hypothetical protein [Candidatus Polarisedimenticolia bacterium]